MEQAYPSTTTGCSHLNWNREHRFKIAVLILPSVHGQHTVVRHFITSSHAQRKKKKNREREKHPSQPQSFLLKRNAASPASTQLVQALLRELGPKGVGLGLALEPLVDAQALAQALLFGLEFVAQAFLVLTEPAVVRLQLLDYAADQARRLRVQLAVVRDYERHRAHDLLRECSLRWRWGGLLLLLLLLLGWLLLLLWGGRRLGLLLLERWACWWVKGSAG